MKRFTSLAVGTSVLALASSALAQANFNESEPNDSKADANVVNCMTAGDTITGNSTASTGVGLDYFDVTVCPAPLGIYRHRLVITTTGTAGHTGTIRGLNQIAAPGDTFPGIPWDGVVGSPGTTDTTIQTSSTTTTPPRFNQWYGFGKSERLYYRVTGTSTTTADYVATMETVPVAVMDIGSFAPGLITLDTLQPAHTTDTDLWVYDSNLDPIMGFGNDDESVLGGSPGDPPNAPGATLRSWLARTYAPGVYYLAISNFNLTNNQPSPSDDDFRTGALLDFANLIANTSTTANLPLDFVITDSSGTAVTVPNVKAGPYDVNWFKFTVIPEPATLVLLALGAVTLWRRRA